MLRDTFEIDCAIYEEPRATHMSKKANKTETSLVDQVVQQAEAAGVRLVRCLYTDNGGTIRGKATHVNGLRDRISDGIGLTVAMQAMNMLDQLAPVEGMGPVG